MTPIIQQDQQKTYIAFICDKICNARAGRIWMTFLDFLFSILSKVEQIYVYRSDVMPGDSLNETIINNQAILYIK